MLNLRVDRIGAQRGFWERKSAHEMNEEEWGGAPHDGYARCCLARIEETISRQIVETSVACRLLDAKEMYLKRVK